LTLGHNLTFSGQFACTIKTWGFNTIVLSCSDWRIVHAFAKATTFLAFISSCLKFSYLFSCSSGEGALISASGHREQSEVSDSLWSAHTTTQ